MKVKIKGKVLDNVLVAKAGVAMPPRYTCRVGTGVQVEVPKTHCLCMAIVPELSKRGLVATNAPGRFTSGEVYVDALNAGREIVSIKDGDPLVQVWVEKIEKFSWEEIE